MSNLNQSTGANGDRTPSNGRLEHDASLPSVLTAVAHDAKALVVAHVETLRTDLGQRVDAVGALVRNSGAAIMLGLVTAMMVVASLVISLVALGVPAWIAAWGVTVPLAVALLLPIARARRAGRATTAAPGDVARELANDPVPTVPSTSEELP